MDDYSDFLDFSKFAEVARVGTASDTGIAAIEVPC
jgi:hypothetical protein